MSNPTSDAPLKILVIDENPIRRAILETGLRDAGFDNITLLGDTTGLLDRIYSVDPDVILIDLENPSRDVLEQMFQVSRIVRRPIAMFVDQSDRATIEAAMEAGVSAYIVDGLKQERVRAILDMTHLALQRLRPAALRARGDQERAQGAQGDREGQGHPDEKPRLDEEAAYALLRQTAMSKGKRIADVAESLVSTFDLLRD